MALKHKVTVNVANSHGKRETVLRGADMKLPTWLAKFLFGGYTQVFLLAPGQTVKSVDIKELKEGGSEDE